MKVFLRPAVPFVLGMAEQNRAREGGNDLRGIVRTAVIQYCDFIHRRARDLRKNLPDGPGGVIRGDEGQNLRRSVRHLRVGECVRVPGVECFGHVGHDKRLLRSQGCERMRGSGRDEDLLSRGVSVNEIFLCLSGGEVLEDYFDLSLEHAEPLRFSLVVMMSSDSARSGMESVDEPFRQFPAEDLREPAAFVCFSFDRREFFVCRCRRHQLSPSHRFAE